MRVETPETTATVEGIEDQIRNLSPQTDAQRAFQAHALAITGDLLDTRWSVFGAVASAIPTPFLVIVVFWLAVLFWSFGLFAPRNVTVIAVLVLCALSVAASIFLILEMEQPVRRDHEGLERPASLHAGPSRPVNAGAGPPGGGSQISDARRPRQPGARQQSRAIATYSCTWIQSGLRERTGCGIP